MVFTTYIFVFYFLPIVLAFYYFVPRLGGTAGLSSRGLAERQRDLALGQLCLLRLVEPLVCAADAGRHAGQLLVPLLVGRPGAGPRQALLRCDCGNCRHLSALAFFKYFTFFQANLNQVLSCSRRHGPRAEHRLAVGISFYTFHALSYTIDVYRGTAPPARSLVDFACTLPCFPQLVAGPIIRYNTVSDQLVAVPTRGRNSPPAWRCFHSGSPRRFCWPIRWARSPTLAFGADRWRPRTPGSAQRPMRFRSIRLLRLFRHGRGAGPHVRLPVPEELQFTYQAESITDFWRRWHISLSTFLRDYLYIPLAETGSAPDARISISSWSCSWAACGTRQLDVRGLGRLPRRAPGLRAIAGQAERVSPSAAAGPDRDNLRARIVLLGALRSATITEAIRFFGAMFGGGGAGVGSLVLPAQLYGQGSLIHMRPARWCGVAHPGPRLVEKITWARRRSSTLCSALR